MNYYDAFYLSSDLKSKVFFQIKTADENNNAENFLEIIDRFGTTEPFPQELVQSLDPAAMNRMLYDIELRPEMTFFINKYETKGVLGATEVSLLGKNTKVIIVQTQDEEIQLISLNSLI